MRANLITGSVVGLLDAGVARALTGRNHLDDMPESTGAV